MISASAAAKCVQPFRLGGWVVELLVLLLGVIPLTGCHDPTDVLAGHSFSDGDWLLVKWDGLKNRHWIIDDERVLAANALGIKVQWEEGHMWTTCDGGYEIYWNGELVHRQDFLDDGYISESEEIRAAFRPAEDFWIETTTLEVFQHAWDSLKAIPGHYPTRYHQQPEDRDIILFYRFSP